MDITSLIRKAIDSPEYSEGLNDALEFLKTEDQGIATFEKLVESINKEDENDTTRTK